MYATLNTTLINNNHDDDDDDDDDLLYWPIWQFTVLENIVFLHPCPMTPFSLCFHAVRVAAGRWSHTASVLPCTSVCLPAFCGY